MNLVTNTQRVIDDYEHHTASANKRIEAAAKAAKAGYQIGFIIAPVFLYENWKEEFLWMKIKKKNKTVTKNSSAHVFGIKREN